MLGCDGLDLLLPHHSKLPSDLHAHDGVASRSGLVIAAVAIGDDHSSHIVSVEQVVHPQEFGQPPGSVVLLDSCGPIEHAIALRGGAVLRVDEHLAAHQRRQRGVEALQRGALQRRTPGQPGVKLLRRRPGQGVAVVGAAGKAHVQVAVR